MLQLQKDGGGTPKKPSPARENKRHVPSGPRRKSKIRPLTERRKPVKKKSK